MEIDNVKPLNDFLEQSGMPIYGCPTPNGYKNTQDAWLNPDSITRRLNFSTNLSSGKLPLLGTQPPNPTPVANSSVMPIDPTQLATTLGDEFSPKTQQAISASAPEIRAALMLGSPEFMNH